MGVFYYNTKNNDKKAKMFEGRCIAQLSLRWCLVGAAGQLVVVVWRQGRKHSHLQGADLETCSARWPGQEDRQLGFRGCERQVHVRHWLQA